MENKRATSGWQERKLYRSRSTHLHADRNSISTSNPYPQLEDLGDREGSSVEGSQDPFKSQDREFLRCSALQNHFCLILAEQASKFFFFYHRRGIKHQPATSLLHGEWHFRKQPVGLVLSACICSEMHILTKARRTQLFRGEGKEMQGVAAVCILVQLV